MVISVSRVALALLVATSVTYAQLTGSVGPTTPLSSKRNTICNVLDYGGTVGSSVQSSDAVFVPPISHDLHRISALPLVARLPTASWKIQVLHSMFLREITTCRLGKHWPGERNGPSRWTVLLRVLVSMLFLFLVLWQTRYIYLATTSGHMIVVENATDFEMYSSNSAGAIQGNGYQCRNAGWAQIFFHIDPLFAQSCIQTSPSPNCYINKFLCTWPHFRWLWAFAGDSMSIDLTVMPFSPWVPCYRPNGL